METPVKRTSQVDGPRQLIVNGNNLAIWERPGSDPPVIFFHGAGFHARCWDEVITRLPGRRCIAVDFRGHGQSSRPLTPGRWREFGQDAAAVAHALGLRGAIGVGHSLGGHAATLAAAIRPEAFAELVLIDPVILPESMYAGLAPEVSNVAKRRNYWPSWTDFFYRLKDRSPFDKWHRKVLLDYCEYGLVPRTTGDGYELACPPAVEASIYQHSTDVQSNIYPEVRTVQASVMVVRCRRSHRETGSFSSSRTAIDLASKFPHAIEVYYPEHSHFLPMEVPHLVADLVRHQDPKLPLTHYRPR